MSGEPQITVDEAQQRVKQTAKYPSANQGLDESIQQCINGMMGELGETAEKWKKYKRGDPQANRDDYIEEMTDIMWYWLQLCNESGISAEVALRAMVDKVEGRKERGVIKGEGDDR